MCLSPTVAVTVTFLESSGAILSDVLSEDLNTHVFFTVTAGGGGKRGVLGD